MSQFSEATLAKCSDIMDRIASLIPSLALDFSSAEIVGRHVDLISSECYLIGVWTKQTHLIRGIIAQMCDLNITRCNCGLVFAEVYSQVQTVGTRQADPSLFQKLVAVLRDAKYQVHTPAYQY